MKSKLTFIIPINEYDKIVQDNLNKTIKSIDEMKGVKGNRLTLVCSAKIKSEIEKNYQGILPLTIIECEDEGLIQKINKGVYQCLTKYFTVLEPDICVMEYWGELAINYMDSHENCGVLLPIFETYNDNKFVGFKNEVAWSPSFIKNDSELGKISNDELEDYKDFDIYGGLVRTESFIQHGGLKPSFKVAVWYEFMLRMFHNNIGVNVLPKVGYIRNLNISTLYKKMLQEVAQDEGAWLIDRAIEESFFTEDRNKIFQKIDNKE